MSKNDPRWDRIKDLFAAAQAVPESERESFLRERGAGADTVHEVLELLGAEPPAQRTTPNSPKSASDK